MSRHNVVILLPAYNEEKAIRQTIEDFYRVMPQAKLVVINNNSVDQTVKIAQETFQKLNFEGIILHESRKGKANAIRKAIHQIDAEIYVMVDSDYTYLADDLPKLLKPVQSGECQIVVGDRHADSMYQKQNTRMFHNFGNHLVKGLINYLFKSSFQDIMSGYRIMHRDFVKNLPILSAGFELETEMTLQAVDKRFSVQEIPISYRPRPEGSFSKLNTFADGFRILKLIFKIFKDYKPLVFFGLLSIVFFILGFVAGIPIVIEFRETGLVPRFPTAILATGFMIFGLLFFTVGLILDTVSKFNREQFELNLLRQTQKGKTS